MLREGFTRLFRSFAVVLCCVLSFASPALGAGQARSFSSGGSEPIYLVIRTDESVGNIDVGIGPGDQDPTQSVTIASQSGSSYSGMFFPDTTPAFHAVDPSPRFESSDLWTFTKSAAPMADGWGTWEL